MLGIGTLNLSIEISGWWCCDSKSDGFRRNLLPKLNQFSYTLRVLEIQFQWTIRNISTQCRSCMLPARVVWLLSSVQRGIIETGCTGRKDLEGWKLAYSIMLWHICMCEDQNLSSKYAGKVTAVSVFPLGSRGLFGVARSGTWFGSRVSSLLPLIFFACLKKILPLQMYLVMPT